MPIACVIPARYNSSRFPGKLLKIAEGKTVLQRTLESAKNCPSIDFLFVATDNPLIQEHITSLGGEVIWTSPSCQNGTERIYDALTKDERLQNSSFIVNLQGDHPCTQSETLTAIIEALKNDPNAQMATAVTPIEQEDDYLSPHVVKVVFDDAGNALYFSRSPIPYKKPGRPLKAYGHIGIYCYRTSFLKKILTLSPSFLQESEDLEQLRVLENGFRIKIAVVKETMLGIDTPADLEKLKEYLT